VSNNWGLLHGRFEQSQLNGIDDDRGEIPVLSPAEASKVSKILILVQQGQVGHRNLQDLA
jgi:hypothetical protein